MKPVPVPKVSGNTESERFDKAVRKMFPVSKWAYLKEARLKRARARMKHPRKPAWTARPITSLTKALVVLVPRQLPFWDAAWVYQRRSEHREREVPRL